MNFKLQIIKYLKKLIKLPLNIAFNKAIDKLLQNNRDLKIFKKYTQTNLYDNTPNWINNSFNHYFQVSDINTLTGLSNEILFLSEKYLKHEFSYLIPDWKEVSHSIILLGNHTQEQVQLPSIDKNVSDKIQSLSQKKLLEWVNENIVETHRQVSLDALKLITDEYKFIDWQLDYKSGFRWDEKLWNKRIVYGNIKGVDIKLPWELGRMQHLPTLALAAHLSEINIPEFHNSVIYPDEFKNQVLDFIAMNPIGFGAQWMNSMDVSLRAVSWLVAYDLFNSFGYKFNEDFERLFRISIYHHCRYILDNLEWSSGMRGNHYLANIAGIIFISAYLPESVETTLWLAFGIQELIREVLYQFNEDGSNFEASVNYHFFAADMVFFPIYILSCLSETRLRSLKFFSIKSWNYKRKLLSYDNQLFKIELSTSKLILPEQFTERITKIIEFTLHLNSEIYTTPQIGDNDSGRFLKLIPNSDKYLHLFLAEYIFNTVLSGDSIDKQFFNSILNKIKLPTINFDSINVVSNYKKLFQNNSPELLYTKDFPDYGLYIFNNKSYKLFLRCGSIGQRGKGGHSHNDQLSICLYINNIEFFTDPGTFTYTSDPELRNHYRSTKMHNTLCVEAMEQNEWDSDSKDDLFWIRSNKSNAKILKYENKFIEGVHFGFDKPHIRRIIFDDKNIIIEDVCKSKSQKSIRFHLHPAVKIIDSGINNLKLISNGSAVKIEFENAELRIEKYNYSPNYGIAINSFVIVATLHDYNVHTKITIL